MKPYCNFRFQAVALWAMLICTFPFRLAAQECGTITDEAALRLEAATLEALHHYHLPAQAGRAPDVLRIQPHVFTGGDGAPSMSQEALDRELRQLNGFFAPMNVRFDMCEPNIIKNTNLYDFNSRDEGQLLPHRRENVINVFFPRSVEQGQDGVCGYAYFPSSGKNIVLVAAGCATNGTTLAHEIGHYFFLWHTHGKTNNGTTDELVNGSNCQVAGDNLCDTPADPNLAGKVNSSCQYIGNETDRNGDPFAPNTRNIMSYAPASCRNLFTNQQYERMRFYLENTRQELFEPSTDCEVFSIDNCVFDVNTTEDTGPGSLRYAIRCANLNPGPDTIRFDFPPNTENTLLLRTSLPALNDDGTVIDGRSANGAKVRLSASRIALSGARVDLLKIQAKGVEIYGLTIENLLRNEIQSVQNVSVIAVEDFADEFVIAENTFINNLSVLRIGRAYGRVMDNRIERNALPILFTDRANGVMLRRNSISCNAQPPLDFTSETALQYFPAPPEVTTINRREISGTATPGATVDVFERDLSACQFTACQGVYVGAAQAGSDGNWQLPYPAAFLKSYTVTQTVEQAGKAFTSTYADCREGLQNRRLWVYPNPSQGVLQIEIKGQTAFPLEVEVLDLLGRKVASFQLQKNAEYFQAELDLSRLAAGHYLLRTQIDEQLVVQRIMLE